MTGFPRLRLTPPSWLRLPLLYGALFLISGAALLSITYLLFEQAIDTPLSGGNPTSIGSLAPPNSKEQVQTLGAAARAAAAAQIAADKHDLLIDSAIALAIVAALAVLLGWFFAGRMLRPVRTITAAARRISATSLDERLGLDGADEEFRQLGDTLDDLFARLEAAFEAQRHFVANASHELRTPLTLEQALLEAVLTDPDPDPESWRDACERALAASRQQGHLIEALLTLARSEGGLDRLEDIDLGEICDDVLLRPDLDVETLGLHVETTIRPAPLDGDPRLIERLVTNLIANGLGHNVAGGQVQVSTAVIDGRATLSVTNTGPVIPPGEIDRLFQAFQRLDPSRTHHTDGHGLGLSIVRAITDAHGATITAQPRPEGGLTVTVTFAPPQSGERAVATGQKATARISDQSMTPRQGFANAQPDALKPESKGRETLANATPSTAPRLEG
jgi:signal transduction histidine kinase